MIWIGAIILIIWICCFRIASESVEKKGISLGILDIIFILLFPLTILFLGIVTFFNMLRNK